MLKMFMSAAALLALGMGAEFPHVSLAKNEAPIDPTHKVVVRIPHGCEGASSNVVRVQTLEGMISVKPQPKVGWTLGKVRGKYEKTYITTARRPAGA